MTDEELTRRFEAIDEQFKTVATKSDVKAEGIATRRHFDIVAEAMKSDITLIASGHESLAASHTKLTVAQHRLEARQDRLEIRQLALETKRRTPKKGR